MLTCELHNTKSCNASGNILYNYNWKKILKNKLFT